MPARWTRHGLVKLLLNDNLLLVISSFLIWCLGALMFEVVRSATSVTMSCLAAVMGLWSILKIILRSVLRGLLTLIRGIWSALRIR